MGAGTTILTGTALAAAIYAATYVSPEAAQAVQQIGEYVSNMIPQIAEVVGREPDLVGVVGAVTVGFSVPMVYQGLKQGFKMCDDETPANPYTAAQMAKDNERDATEYAREHGAEQVYESPFSTAARNSELPAKVHDWLSPGARVVKKKEEERQENNKKCVEELKRQQMIEDCAPSHPDIPYLQE